MKNLVFRLLVGGLALLGGCHAATDKTATTPASSPAPSLPKVLVNKLVAAVPFTGYRRYRGTVGRQPVTVELTIDSAREKPVDMVCEGFYSYDRHAAGGLVLRAPRPYQLQQPLVLAETDAAHANQPTGRWQAEQPAGPTLTGTWISPAGKQLPFSLHEDYTDGQGHVVAVQYELLQEGDEVPCQPERKAGESKAAYRARTKGLTSSYSRFFLHLLGPDTLRPALRALQCPVPAKRRRQMREELNYPGCNQFEHQLSVSYNEHGLLSLSSFDDVFYEGTDHPEHGASAITYDLHTGRALTIAALIRLGTDTILSRLIAQHLEQDENITCEELFNRSAADSLRAPFPQQGLGIVDEGLALQYSTYEVQPVHPPVAVVVPWRELLPLLRPDSPVARMLRERGLWPKAKPR